MIENSKITNTYKSEITEILKRVSKGLSDHAMDVIEPKIEDISLKVKTHIHLIQQIKDENERLLNNLNDVVRNQESSINSIKNSTTNIDNSFEEKYLKIITDVDKNHNNALREFEKVIIESLYSKINELLNEKKINSLETKIIEIQIKQKKGQILSYIIVGILLLILLVVTILFF